MTIVVIGGTGLIGSKVVRNLRELGHDAVVASPGTGVNTFTGEGLEAALAGADVVVDLANSPSFEDAAVLEFFRTAGTNLLAAEAAAGIRHHVALTIVGADRVPDSGYMRAKVVQEQVIRSANRPYTIVRSTQFCEFLRPIADAATEDGTVRVPTGLLQPIAAEDVAAAVTRAAVSDPVNGMVELGGPQKLPFAEAVGAVLAADHDTRRVVSDEHARYFGTELTGDAITTGPGAELGRVTLAEWIAANPRRPPGTGAAG